MYTMTGSSLLSSCVLMFIQSTEARINYEHIGIGAFGLTIIFWFMKRSDRREQEEVEERKARRQVEAKALAGFEQALHALNKSVEQQGKFQKAEDEAHAQIQAADTAILHEVKEIARVLERSTNTLDRIDGRIDSIATRLTTLENHIENNNS